jgi:predicted nucleotidyltransferase
MLDSAVLETPERVALEALKMRLRAEYGASLRKLSLYGSRARGDAGSSSDVDVAIVIDGLDSAGRNQVYRVVAEIEVEHAVPLSAIAMSSERFAELLSRERGLALDIEAEGIAL